MRTLGWKKIGAADYRQCYEQFGGSVITHPDVLEFIHARRNCRPGYYGRAERTRPLSGALCRWGSYLAGDERALRTLVRPAYDFGAPEIIVPMDETPEAGRKFMFLRTSHLSALNRGAFANLLSVDKCRRKLALVKGLGDEGCSAKTRRNRQASVRKFLEAGGEVRDVSQYDAGSLADIYLDLYRARWGGEPCTRTQLVDMISSLKHLVFGHVLWLNGEPCAYDLVLAAESPRHLSAECINGGVDPRHSALSPGTVLMWLNVTKAWDAAQAAGRELRFSLGRMEKKYKEMWCAPAPLYRTLTL